jgi:hypothetical protein
MVIPDEALQTFWAGVMIVRSCARGRGVPLVRFGGVDTAVEIQVERAATKCSALFF